MASNSRSKTKLNVLDKVPFSELEALRVAIHRKNVAQTESIPPFERKIDDPKTITAIVHSKKDSTRKSIFDREGVLVNQYDDDIIKTRVRSHSRSRSSSSSTNRRSSDRYRKSNNEKTDKTPRPRSNSREKDRDWSDGREKSPVRERRKYSPERGKNDRDKSVERRKDYNPYNRDRDEPHRGRSRSPQHYRRRSTSRGRDDERRRRSRSASRSRYVPPYPRKSVSPKYHKSAYHKEHSRSPNRADKNKRLKYSEPSSRRSRSFEREKRDRSRERHRFSRSPPGPSMRYDKERKKSRSPNRSPPRYDKYRRSRSPHRYDHYKEATEKRSSRSPRKLSGSRPDYKHARSPEYDRERRYRSTRDRRSKSRSPKPGVRSSLPPHRSREIEYGYYEGYPGAELWLPGALPPGYPIPRFYPRPGPFFPRQPIVIPPQVPLSYQPYRPRYPVYNSKYNMKHSIQSEIVPPPKPSTETNATGDGTVVVVQEVKDDGNNKETESGREKVSDDGKD